MIQLSLTDQQVDQVLNALALRPYAEVAPLINELVQQVQPQKQAQNMQQPLGAALQGGLNGAGASAQ